MSGTDKEKLEVLWKIQHLRFEGIKFRYLSTQNSLKEITFEYTLGKFISDENNQFNHIVNQIKENNPDIESIIKNYINENKSRLLRLQNSPIWNKISHLSIYD